MKFQVTHTTRYCYQEIVSQCHSVAHLLPRNTSYQQCTRAEFQINPPPASGVHRTDYFGNHSYHFSVQIPHRTLEVTATSEVEITGERQNLALDFGSSCAEVRAMLTRIDRQENLLARECTLDSPMVGASAELADYARSSFRDDEPFFSCVRDLTRRIFEEFTYDTRHTDVATPLSEVIRHRRGVCQDFAHLGIGCLRSLGFPARYVSGYLETLPPPGGTRLTGVDASHAWFAAYSPTGGWCDFDPTNNLLASRQHITTAWGRDYADVTPMKGTIVGGGASHTLEVAVDVKRLDEAG